MYDQMKLTLLHAWPEITRVLRKRRKKEEVTVRDIARIGRAFKGGVFSRTEEEEFENQEGLRPKSRMGPQTEEGKARSGAVHLKHGHYTKEALRERRLEREARDYWAFHLGIRNLMMRFPSLEPDYWKLWKRLSGQEIFQKHIEEEHIKQRFAWLLIRGELPFLSI